MTSWFQFNPNGQIKNYFAVILFMFTFAFLTILGMTLFNAQIDSFNSSGVWTPEMQTASQGFFASYLLYDYIAVIMLIVLVVGVVLTSYKLNTSPAFFVISFILGIFFTLASYFMNHMFIEMISIAQFAPVLKYFPKMLIICTNLHWVGLLIFVVGSIALYAKKDSESDIQGGAF